MYRLTTDKRYSSDISAAKADIYNTVCNDSWGSSSFARCLIEVNSEADLVDVVTIGIPSLSEDDFTKETIHTTGNSSKKDNLSMSNSFSALNEEEEVENVYDELANLIQKIKAGGSSSFTAAAG
ncbi:hypothetical protein Tco_0818632 [Tanacetum coccineum]